MLTVLVLPFVLTPCAPLPWPFSPQVPGSINNHNLRASPEKKQLFDQRGAVRDKKSDTIPFRQVIPAASLYKN